MYPIATVEPSATLQADRRLMERVALTRLRRFERVAAVAAESGSPLWRALARSAAAAALRDCLLLGLDGQVGPHARRAERSPVAS
jgi:hypothetical protein